MSLWRAAASEGVKMQDNALQHGSASPVTPPGGGSSESGIFTHKESNGKSLACDAPV